MGASRIDDNGVGNGNLDYRSPTFNQHSQEFARCDEWNQIVPPIRDFLKSERGSAESAMVLIPLLFLFLCGAQLTSTVFIRNFEMARAQSDASSRAIADDIHPSDRIINVDTGNRFTTIRLLVTEKRRDLPILIPGLAPLFGGALRSEVRGVSVIEGDL